MFSKNRFERPGVRTSSHEPVVGDLSPDPHLAVQTYYKNKIQANWSTKPAISSVNSRSHGTHINKNINFNKATGTELHNSVEN